MGSSENGEVSSRDTRVSEQGQFVRKQALQPIDHVANISHGCNVPRGLAAAAHAASG